MNVCHRANIFAPYNFSFIAVLNVAISGYEVKENGKRGREIKMQYFIVARCLVVVNANIFTTIQFHFYCIARPFSSILGNQEEEGE